MIGFLIRWAVCALGLWIAQALVSGIEVDGGASLALAAVILGAVNAFVRPLVVLLTLPLTVVTLGLFLWIINGAMLSLVSWLMNGFNVASFGAALLGALIVSLTSWVASWYVGPRGNVEIMVVRR
jgi:putative membrane protein